MAQHALPERSVVGCTRRTAVSPAQRLNAHDPIVTDRPGTGTTHLRTRVLAAQGRHHALADLAAALGTGYIHCRPNAPVGLRSRRELVPPYPY